MDTGPVTSDGTAVTYAGNSRASARGITGPFEVTAKDASAWAPVAWFETAYLSAGEWKGAWIPARPGHGHPHRRPGRRGRLLLPGVPHDASRSGGGGGHEHQGGDHLAIAPGVRFTYWRTDRYGDAGGNGRFHDDAGGARRGRGHER